MSGRREFGRRPIVKFEPFKGTPAFEEPKRPVTPRNISARPLKMPRMARVKGS